MHDAHSLAKSRWGYPIEFIQRIFDRYGGETTPMKCLSDLFDLLLYFKRYGVLGTELTFSRNANSANFYQKMKHI